MKNIITTPPPCAGQLLYSDRKNANSSLDLGLYIKPPAFVYWTLYRWLATNNIYSGPRNCGIERATYPICLLVEGAWVMTELDWGEGSACWITMLLSWLAILEWVCWCWLGPPWPWRVMFCSETQRVGWGLWAQG